MSKAFSKADDILASATKGIAEIITVESAFIRVDYADLRRVMKGSGRAHMGVATAEGEDRAREAARRSLCSPLLNSNLISGAKKILLSIAAASVDDISYKEAMEVLRYIQTYASYTDDETGTEHKADIIWGASQKPLPDGVLEVIVVATGFDDNEPVLSRQKPVAPFEDMEIEVEPIKDPVPPVAPMPPRPSGPAVLERKPSKYENIETELRIPSFRRRNVELKVGESTSRRREVLQEEQPEPAANDNKLF
jgi:cell division protein FtsZ